MVRTDLHQRCRHGISYSSPIRDHLDLQGQVQNVQKGVWKGVAWTTCPLASYIDNFYFSENSVKIIQNFKEKEAAMVTLGYPYTPKSTLLTNHTICILGVHL